MSRKTVCSSAVRLPFVLSSKTERRSMISLACGKLTGRDGCLGSSCSPINMSDEEPSEITKEENVTGSPGASGWDALLSGWEVDAPGFCSEEAVEGLSGLP